MAFGGIEAMNLPRNPEILANASLPVWDRPCHYQKLPENRLSLSQFSPRTSEEPRPTPKCCNWDRSRGYHSEGCNCSWLCIFDILNLAPRKSRLSRLFLNGLKGCRSFSESFNVGGSSSPAPAVLAHFSLATRNLPGPSHHWYDSSSCFHNEAFWLLALFLDRVHYPPHLKKGTKFSNNTTKGKRLRELKGNKRGREKRKGF